MTENAPEQPQKIDVGAVLRKKRQLRGLTHETVHQHTRVPKRLIEALENNDTHAFAAPVYLRGFLKCYCEYLELDFEPLWAELSGQTAQPAPAPVRREKADTPKPAAKDKDSSSRMTLPLSDPTLIPVLLIVGLFAAGGVLWLVTRGREAAAPAANLPPPPPAAVAPVLPPVDMTLRVVSRKETWIRLAVDGALRFEGRLPASARPEWKGKKAFALRAAEPKDLRVLLDGATVQLTSFPKDSDGSYLVAR
ncbi:MAG: helix-turn-helix domain-containing protein [Elusimicrobiota bacterium]|jgi:hypothetical protein